MKTYSVEFGKEEYETLVAKAGMPASGKISKGGWHVGGLRPVAVTSTGKVSFTRRRDSVRFAAWAAGWIAAVRRDGNVPMVSLMW